MSRDIKVDVCDTAHGHLNSVRPLGFKWRSAHEKVKQQAAERENVHREPLVCAALHHFRGEKVWGPTKGGKLGVVVWASYLLCQTKVSQLHLQLSCQQDICIGYVPVHNAIFVQVLDCLSRLSRRWRQETGRVAHLRLFGRCLRARICWGGVWCGVRVWCFECVLSVWCVLVAVLR